MVFGTHIDQLGSETNSAIEKINESLDEIIRAQKFLDLVHYADRKLGKVMYLVDNTSKEDLHFQMLRSSIHKYICDRSEFTIEYPVSYLLFCLQLQSIKETVLSMKVYIQLAANFGILDIKSLLHFLHFRVGIIQHYDVEGLSDLIIKEPQVLFNKVTDLLVKTFLLSGPITITEQEGFCKKGILDASVFDNIFRKDDKITSEQFLCFLLNLCIAIPFTDKNGILKYFIPSVLNHFQTLPPTERKTDITQLAITFQQGHCPKGLLGMLVSHLMSPEMNQEFTFDLLEDNIHQDQVSLLVHSTEDVDEICLKRHLSHLEVTMFLENYSIGEESHAILASRENTPTEVCNAVRLILQNCLHLSLKTLHYDCKKVGPMFCLMCPHKDCFLQHEVKEGKRNCCLHCSNCRRKFKLPTSGGHWFNEGRFHSNF